MSASQPFFTVIIPTYNRAKTIRNTLNSVYNQSFKDFEILIIDNKSNDNIKEILSKDILENRITFIQNDSNFERSYSRNRGLDLANGKFALLLDSDDLLYSDCLQDALEYYQSNPQKKVFHNLYEFVHEDGSTSKGSDLYDPNNTIKSISRGNFLACNGVFIARELYQKYRFDLDAVGSEDWDFWLRVIADSKSLGRINKVNSAIFQHSDRSVLNMDLKKLEKVKQHIIQKIIDTPHLMEVYRPYLGFMKGSSYLFLGSMANTIGKHSTSLNYVLKATIAFPLLILSKRYVIVLVKAILRSK